MSRFSRTSPEALARPSSSARRPAVASREQRPPPPLGASRGERPAALAPVVADPRAAVPQVRHLHHRSPVRGVATGRSCHAVRVSFPACLNLPLSVPEMLLPCYRESPVDRVGGTSEYKVGRGNTAGARSSRWTFSAFDTLGTGTFSWGYFRPLKFNGQNAADKCTQYVPARSRTFDVLGTRHNPKSGQFRTNATTAGAPHSECGFESNCSLQ